MIFFAALLDNFPDDLSYAFFENCAQTVIVETDQPLDQQPRYQQ